MDTRLRLPAALVLVLLLGGCDFVGDVLEVGFWTGVIVVILVIALLAWIVYQFFD